MAKPPAAPASDDAFIREVDEELRRDQLARLWNRYGRALLLLVAVGLIGLAGYMYWNNLQNERHARSSLAYDAAVAAFESGDFDAARAAFAPIASGDDAGYAALARLADAAMSFQLGDTGPAAEAFGVIAADPAVPPALQDYARLKQLQIDFDNMAADARIAALEPLAQSGAPWFGPAGELLAVAYLEAGQPAQAKRLFEALGNSPEVVPTLRMRAAQMAAMVSASEEDAPADAPPVEPGPEDSASTRTGQAASQDVTAGEGEAQ